MKFTIAALSLASAAVALPTSETFRSSLSKRASNVTDLDILQYALTLEHLEAKFYKDALAKYDNAAFVKAGLPDWARGRFEQIASHEATHVSTLQGAIKDAKATPTSPCTYKFPYTDPASFAAFSGVLEGVGVSAYLGAANLIQEPAYVTVAGSILTTEARHQGWVMSAVEKAQPWSGPNDTPLSLNDVYTIAAQFITDCPKSNPRLPVMAYPALTVSAAKPGETATFTFDSKANTKYYAAFYSGLDIIPVPLSNKKGKVPSTLQGTYYTIITTEGDKDKISGANTVAGPAIGVVNFWSAKSN